MHMRRGDGGPVADGLGTVVVRGVGGVVSAVDLIPASVSETFIREPTIGTLALSLPYSQDIKGISYTKHSLLNPRIRNEAMAGQILDQSFVAIPRAPPRHAAPTPERGCAGSCVANLEEVVGRGEVWELEEEGERDG
jgi:hypothetical protein